MNVTVPILADVSIRQLSTRIEFLTGSAISILIFAGAWNYWGRGQFRNTEWRIQLSTPATLRYSWGTASSTSRLMVSSTTEIGMENYAVATS